MWIILELTRLAIHPDYQVKNLASYLISKSIKYIRKYKSEVRCLVSFADSTHNHSGVVYKASNWVLDGMLMIGVIFVIRRLYGIRLRDLV